MSSTNFDVLIIGAGVIGSAIAFRLAESGLKIALADDRALGSNASCHNAGNLNPLLNTSDKIINSAIKSLDIHKELRKRLINLGCSKYLFEKVDRIILAFNKEDEIRNQSIANLYNSHDTEFSGKIINPSEIKTLDNRIASSAISAAYISGNMAIDSFAYNAALIDGFRSLGGILFSTKITSIKNQEEVIIANTDFGHISSQYLIAATGPWTEIIEKELSTQVPVKPLKGELLRLYLPGNKFVFDLTHKETSIYQRGKSNEVWVGGTNEDVGFDVTISKKSRDEILARAEIILPDIKNATVLEHTAALRSVTNQGIPFFENLSHHKNIFIANGGSWKGALFSAILSELAYEKIINKKTIRLN